MRCEGLLFVTTLSTASQHWAGQGEGEGEGGSSGKTYTWYEMIRAGHPGHPDTGHQSQECRAHSQIELGVMQDNQFRQR